MKTPNEFWLCLHQFADAYGAEGDTSRQRAENILEQFRHMPTIARRELLADFALIAVNLTDLYRGSVAVHNEAELHAKPVKAENVA